MIKECKICGVSDSKTLSYIINHPHPPQFVGFICNYKKSSRYVEITKLKKLLTANGPQEMKNMMAQMANLSSTDKKPDGGRSNY